MHLTLVVSIMAPSLSVIDQSKDERSCHSETRVALVHQLMWAADDPGFHGILAARPGRFARRPALALYGSCFPVGPTVQGFPGHVSVSHSGVGAMYYSSAQLLEMKYLIV